MTPALHAVRGRPVGRQRARGPLHAVPADDRTRTALCGARVGGARSAWPAQHPTVDGGVPAGGGVPVDGGWPAGGGVPVDGGVPAGGSAGTCAECAAVVDASGPVVAADLAASA